MSSRLVAVALCTLSTGIVLGLVVLIVGGGREALALGAVLALLIGSFLAGVAESADEGKDRR